MISLLFVVMLLRQADTFGWTTTEPCPCCQVGFYKVGTTDEWRMSHAEKFPECMASWAEQHCVAILPYAVLTCKDCGGTAEELKLRCKP